MTGATIFGCAGTVLAPDEVAFFRDADPWGFIVFARNIETPDQLLRLSASLRETVGREAPILIDQEGGRVQRLRGPHWLEWLPPLVQMQRAGDNANRAMWLRYRLIAEELRAVGIDVNCAPMADIAGPETHEFLKNRCYGETVPQVVDAARAVADGLLAGGVLPVLKHIPGHGRATADSHLDLPVVGTDAQTLHDTDFAAFRALNDLPLAMTAHIVFPAFDPDEPATCSQKMMQVIRHDIGFGGLVMSDDVSMQALRGSMVERTKASLRAGCDIVLHCNGNPDEMAGVAAAAGVMTGAAATRAEAALAARMPPEPADTRALQQELSALLAEPDNG